MTTELSIGLNRDLDLPLQLQLVQALKSAIDRGTLAPGAKLPSSRKFAGSLKVSRIVVLNAYDQLLAEGYLEARRGQGTFVAGVSGQTGPSGNPDYAGPEWISITSAVSPAGKAEYDFSMGILAKDILRQPDWRRAWRKALNHSLSPTLPPAQGLSSLRQAVADHVNRYRGISCEAEEIIITSGVADSLDLIARVSRPANPLVYLENPCFNAAAAGFRRYGHRIRLQDIDEEGIIQNDLDRNPATAKILFCTPSHQFPLGPRLSLQRRNDLLHWADTQDALILEDDYDSEFRYGVAPLPSLKSQDQAGHVVYLSSLSKSLSPSLRLGYIIAPARLRQALVGEIDINHRQPPAPVQQAVAEFMNVGDMDRHIRRLHRHYEALNRIIREKLTMLPREVGVLGLEAGIHCFLHIRDRQKYEKLKKAFGDNGIYLPTLERYLQGPSRWQGFGLGYGHFGEEELENALDHLIQTIRQEFDSQPH